LKRNSVDFLDSKKNLFWRSGAANSSTFLQKFAALQMSLTQTGRLLTQFIKWTLCKMPAHGIQASRHPVTTTRYFM